MNDIELNFRTRVAISLLLIILSSGLVCINLIKAQESFEDSPSVATDKLEVGTKIVIKTSRPAKFYSYWLDNPPRLVVEFQTRNILSKIDDEVMVNQGIIKKITSDYHGKGQNRSLKSLTFELIEKVPYKIRQEGNAILLNIQAPLETSGLSISAKGNEVFIEGEARSNVIKKLEAMDTAVLEAAKNRLSLENPEGKVTDKPTEEIGKGEEPIARIANNEAEESKVIPATSVEKMAFGDKTLPLKGIGRPILLGNLKARFSACPGLVFWQARVVRLYTFLHHKVKEVKKDIILLFVGLVSILVWGLLIWRGYNVNKSKNKNVAEKIKELTLQLQKKNKYLEQVEIIRKTIEKTAIEKEKEYEQLKLELQQKNMLFEQEETIRKEKEKTLLELEKEYAQLRETSESLKDILVKRGIARELIFPEKKGELWILGESQDRRNSPRLTLTKDFHNTVILKVELQGILGYIKSFAENINSDGICFETSKEIDDKYPINLRLFFYGSKVSNFKTQGWIVWKRTQDSKNYYGIIFEGLSKKVKSELRHYIDSRIV